MSPCRAALLPAPTAIQPICLLQSSSRVPDRLLQLSIAVRTEHAVTMVVDDATCRPAAHVQVGGVCYAWLLVVMLLRWMGMYLQYLQMPANVRALLHMATRSSLGRRSGSL